MYPTIIYLHLQNRQLLLNGIYPKDDFSTLEPEVIRSTEVRLIYGVQGVIFHNITIFTTTVVTNSNLYNIYIIVLFERNLMFLTVKEH
jgi:hypothetical protein